MLPSLSLHQVHVQRSSILAIPWCGQASSNFTIPEDEELVVDWVNPSCLSVKACSNDLESIMDVDLMLAEVKHDWDSDFNQSVIIVKPWCEAEQNPNIIEISLNRLKSCAAAPTINFEQFANNECQAPEFWIFLVNGGDATVRAALQRMGEGGSVRYNPFEVLELGLQVGAGANAIVYRGKYCHPDDASDAGCKSKIVFKVLHRNPRYATALEELDAIQHEISLVIHAGRHPNIIKFLGAFCLEDEAVTNANASSKSYNVLSKDSPSGLLPRWALVNEYLPGGDFSMLLPSSHSRNHVPDRSWQIFFLL